MTDFTEFLKSLVRDPLLHGRFLNTLSLLEYIGARKILKSQDERHISMELLSHASDELRHARVFKKLAQDIAKTEFDGYSPSQLFCGEEAKEYFQTVDREVQASLLESHLCYRMTTLLVEERVMQIYPAYEQILVSLGYSGRVLGILKEEEKHLNEMQAPTTPLIGSLREKEEIAFQVLFQALTNAVSGLNLSSAAGISPRQSPEPAQILPPQAQLATGQEYRTES